MREGERVPDWPFEDPPNTAAVTTRLVLDDGAPILLVAGGRGGPVAARSRVDATRRGA
jgi:hypothetical protein